jgi:glutamyl-tRNA synthetase
MTDNVVTRFAPSPTGFLHIGGARTALFNWLYAKAKGGVMLLRIEDTDRERSTAEAIDAILDGLDWLGLHWEGEPLFQHSRSERHQEIAEQLLAEGNAYKCYCTAEELAEMREQARAQGKPPVYDGTWRDRDPADASTDVAPSIRFKAPREGETVINDQVQGRVVVANKELDDLILMRSDGSPTYMLSVVVDDHDTGITHVIRGDDHLTNAARQSQIFASLGWQTPIFAHVPLIHGPDGSKLSKRHGALGVEAYRDMGYLPAALRNYLVRLGWSHGDQEIFSTEEMIHLFDLGNIGRSPSRFDLAKLDSLNSHYIKETSDDELIRLIRDSSDHLNMPEASRIPDTEAEWKMLEQALSLLKTRANTLIDLIDKAQFIFANRPIEIDAKARKLLDNDAVSRLGDVAARLEGLEDWSIPSIEAALRAYSEETGLGLGKIAQPLRAALTGQTSSPGIFDVLALLGREESLGRIGDQTASS